jgi:AraC-like DNA-binding protein
MERFFDNKYGLTPGRWLRQLRCDFAVQLISKGWANKAVALELGFGNAAHLCHEFKSIYGLAPQHFAPSQGKTRERPQALPLFSGRVPAPPCVAALSQTPFGRRLDQAIPAHPVAHSSRSTGPVTRHMQIFKNS